MVSHKHRCIFVHLPKTGGTSISKKLGLFSVSSRGVQDHRPIVDIEPLSIAHLRRKCYRQDGLYRYARRQLGNLRKGRRRLSRQDFESYYKFAFVRNSWARVASWYKGVMRDDVIRKGLGVPSDCSLRDFITVHGGQFHLNPQLYWLRNARGQMAMDFIGRFERLQQDFDHVCHTLGIEDSQLPTELMFGGGGGVLTAHCMTMERGRSSPGDIGRRLRCLDLNSANEQLQAQPRPYDPSHCPGMSAKKRLQGMKLLIRLAALRQKLKPVQDTAR